MRRSAIALGLAALLLALGHVAFDIGFDRQSRQFHALLFASAVPLMMIPREPGKRIAYLFALAMFAAIDLFALPAARAAFLN